MKPTLFCLLGLIIATACAPPKYAYHFDRYDYNTGRKLKGEQIAGLGSELTPIEAESLFASKENTLMDNKLRAASATVVEKKTYAQMTWVERKELRRDIKKYIKVKKETVQASKKSNAMDNDLKLAAIFGAVGLVALIISGDVFYILGGIALIIGVVFFVKWLVRQ